MTTPTPDIDALKVSELEGQPIPDHDGIPITRTAAVIRKTGDGLSESMGMSPVHIPVEETVLVLIVAKAKGHKYARVVDGTGKDATVLEEFTETVILDAESALFLDPDLVSGVVGDHMARVRKARSEAEAARIAAKGQGRFQLPDPDEGAEDDDDEMGGLTGSAAAGSGLSLMEGGDGLDPEARAPWEGEGEDPDAATGDLMGERRLEYMRLAEVRPNERNPKDHDLDLIGRSYEEFGYTEPVVLDERTGTLLSGHGRVEELADRHAAGLPVPDGVRVEEDGSWPLPVVRGVATEDDNQADAVPGDGQPVQ